MIVQYLIKWSCRYCGNLHKWWRDSIDIPTESHDVNCTHCGMRHIIKVYTNQVSENAYCEILSPTENGIYLNLGIDEFVKLIPNKETYDLSARDKLITEQNFYDRWSEHDALHFISGNPFTDDGEKRVAYLEQMLKCGWFEYNSFRKVAVPCDYDYITDELLDIIALQIKERFYT